MYYSEFPETTMKLLKNKENTQRILTNITMTYFKNSGSLDSPDSCQDTQVFMTAFGVSQTAATSTKLSLRAREGPEANRLWLVMVSPGSRGGLPHRHNPEMEMTDINVRKIKNKKQTSYKTGLHFFRPYRNFTSERK